MQRYVLGFLLSFVFSIGAWAAELELPKQPTFVNVEAVTVDLLKPPPAMDSDAQKNDMMILLWEQNRRTIYDAERAWGSVTLTPSYFNQALNARFEESRFPLLYNLMNTVLADTRLYVDAFKVHYKRPRPYQDNPKIKPIIPIEESYSYPSGHGTRGMTTALVFAELFPKRKEQLLQVGLTLGQDRVIGGVHYPSDIDASIQLAHALAQSIIASETFKLQVKAAQGEINRIDAGQ